MSEKEQSSSDYLLIFNGKAKCQTPACEWEDFGDITLVVDESENSLGYPPYISIDNFFYQYLINQCQVHHCETQHYNNHNVFSLYIDDNEVGRLAASSEATQISINQKSFDLVKQSGLIMPRDAME